MYKKTDIWCLLKWCNWFISLMNFTFFLLQWCIKHHCLYKQSGHARQNLAGPWRNSHNILCERGEICCHPVARLLCKTIGNLGLWELSIKPELELYHGKAAGPINKEFTKNAEKCKYLLILAFLVKNKRMPMFWLHSCINVTKHKITLFSVLLALKQEIFNGFFSVRVFMWEAVP